MGSREESGRRGREKGRRGTGGGRREEEGGKEGEEGCGGMGRRCKEGYEGTERRRRVRKRETVWKRETEGGGRGG